jgi:glycosyltransferase involved in cell wall biosynthesis
MEKMLPLISVIVPVYKVEPYLRRCIDSIRNQTYTNLEIILVDDGSPDNCGHICDEYAQKDKRILVIHQENGGLSAARNSGLDRCTGDYIGFVDSDDCIHPEMYERLYQDICTYHTRLAFCHPNMCYGSIPDINKNLPTECKDKEFVILKSMTENIWWSAWTKLYERSLFKKLRYPHGKTNEDYAITMYIYDMCDRIAINYNKLYNYCVRENSICTSPLNLKKFDQIDNTLEVMQYMEQKHPTWKPAAEFVFITTLLKLLGMSIENSEKQYIPKKQEIFNLIKRYYSSAIHNPYILFKQKILLTAARISPSCFKLVFRIYLMVQKMKK